MSPDPVIGVPPAAGAQWRLRVVKGECMRIVAMACAALLALLACGSCASAAAPMQEVPAWLAGDWCGGLDGETIEETWLAPRGGETQGLSRTVRGGRVVSFEFLRIVRDGDGVAYIAQPGGRPPVTFRRTAGGADWIRFENPAHDFPRRIEYRLENGGLHAEVAGPGGSGGERVVPYEYRSCPG